MYKTIIKRHNIIQLDFGWIWLLISRLTQAYKQPKTRLVLLCPSSLLPPDSCYNLSDWQQLVNRAMTTFITETAMHNPDPEAGWEPDKVMPHRSVWFYRHLFKPWHHWAAELSWIVTETEKNTALISMALNLSIFQTALSYIGMLESLPLSWVIGRETPWIDGWYIIFLYFTVFKILKLCLFLGLNWNQDAQCNAKWFKHSSPSVHHQSLNYRCHGQ